MARKKHRKAKAARNRTIARKRAQQLKQAQERKRRMRFARRRQMIDASLKRKKAVKYYCALKQSGYTEHQAAKQAVEKYQTPLRGFRSNQLL